MNENPISDIMSAALQNIKEMVDVNTIIGAPIETAGGTTIIPVSKVGFGFAAGGSEFDSKKNEKPDDLFGGGSGAGVSIQPVAFLVVNSAGEVNLIPVSQDSGLGLDKIVEKLPTTVSKIGDYFKKKKDSEEESEE